MYPKVHLETQKSANRQGNTDQKRAMLDVGYYNTQLQTTIQSLINKSSMVLA
jgi:hypothetical protein